MDSHDAAYIAGFLDADGSITITTVHRDFITPYQVVRVCIHQKDIKILLWIKQVTNIGSIQRGKDGMSRWTVASPAAYEFLKDIEAFVKVKANKLDEALYVEECARASS